MLFAAVLGCRSTAKSRLNIRAWGTSFLEKDGTFTNAERRINRVRSNVMREKQGMAAERTAMSRTSVASLAVGRDPCGRCSFAFSRREISSTARSVTSVARSADVRQKLQDR